MTALRKTQLVSVEDYLDGELASPVKHEYLGGYVYAMAGARNQHNLIKMNIAGALFGRLDRKSCRPFDSDTKVRIRLPLQVRFYYPDLSIICRPNPPGDSFQDEPSVLFEVLSPNTRRIDEGEKKDAYLTIPSLSVYALVEQELPLVTVYRRTDEGTFQREVLEGLDAVLSLPEAGIDLPLADIYDGVTFVPEPEDDENV